MYIFVCVCVCVCVCVLQCHEMDEIYFGEVRDYVVVKTTLVKINTDIAILCFSFLGFRTGGYLLEQDRYL